MKKEVFIRVDADPEIGLGHFFRCLALAEFLESHFKITFVSQKINSDLIRRLKEKFNFFKIEKEEDFFKVTKENSLIIVDGYQFTKLFFQKLEKQKVKIICIQDIEHFSEHVDMVINHLPDVEKYYKDVELLAGPEYAIIRRKILKQPVSSKKEKCGYLISLGGTENYLIVNQIIDLINQIDINATIRILTTQSNSKKINSEGIEIYFNQDEEAIIDLIDNAGICLITSGMISYEVLARNRKAIIGALNEGQAEIGEKFEEMGLVEFVGYWKDISLEILQKALKGNAIRSEVVKNIFDGKSDERLLEKILQL